jgi:hypothetical protein
MWNKEAVDKEQNECDQERQPSVSDGALRQQAQNQHDDGEQRGNSHNRPIAKGGISKPVESQQEQADGIEVVSQTIQREMLLGIRQLWVCVFLHGVEWPNEKS